MVLAAGEEKATMSPGNGSAPAPTVDSLAALVSTLEAKLAAQASHVQALEAACQTQLVQQAATNRDYDAKIVELTRSAHAAAARPNIPAPRRPVDRLTTVFATDEATPLALPIVGIDDGEDDDHLLASLGLT